MTACPILFLSDSASGHTGLGRITRELATRIAKHMPDTFRVAVAGYGAAASRHLPFQQYSITKNQAWVVPELPAVWKDFAGDEKGILMTVWNAGWLPWLASPEKYLPKGELQNFLLSDRFEKWGYWPIDAEGPNGMLHPQIVEAIQGFDRSLAYTAWGADVIDRSCWPEGVIATPHLPHGTDTSVFYPRDRSEARARFLATNGKVISIAPDTYLVGIVATNTARKDWALGFETCKILLDHGHKVGLWAHTDSFQKHWDLFSLAEAFGMRERVIFTNDLRDDDQMALSYSACNVTLAIGAGEGWGLPIAESLACGVRAVHGRYGAGAEIMPQWMTVRPCGYRYDGFYGNKRPVFNAVDWARNAGPNEDDDAYKTSPSFLDPKYSWDGCWPEWQQWFEEGIND